MECGVIQEMLRGPIGEVLDTRHMVSDVSGAGNNWAHGHEVYGKQYGGAILESLRHAAEECDSLQGFLLLQSLGGGTGSGVGSYIMEMLADEFSSTYRLASSVFPSEDDDVVTSPYNAMLSLARLVEHADIALPLENQALIDIANRSGVEESGAHPHHHPSSGLPSSSSSASASSSSSNAVAVGASRGSTRKPKPFDSMNSIVASMLLHLTSGMRFPGSLNVDLSDLAMNMAPFPRLHFLVSGFAPLPLAAANSAAANSAAIDKMRLADTSKSIDQLFNAAFSKEHQLIKADPRRGTYLSCGIVVRGSGATISDVNRNVAKIRPTLRTAHWAEAGGFKLGLCSRPPLGHPNAILSLANNSAVSNTFQAIRERFDKLYKRRVYTHHYEQYMDLSLFGEAVEAVTDVAQRYREIDNQMLEPNPIATYKRRPMGLTFL
mmetsp:Transcript_17923/g.32719  ORF Transcript_17923/g.32719 Transcript_17923/m.32719 type:complete len:435 (-) Transcript_17923:313-1617(-)